MKRVTVMRAEVFLVAVFVLLGMGAWVGADRLVTNMLKSDEPSEEAERIAREVPWKRDSLAMTEKERDSTGAKLIEARLDYYRQEAALAALPAAATQGGQAAAQEAERKRAEALAQLKASGAHVDALIARLGILQQSLNQLRREVEEGARASSAEYSRRRVCYRIKKALWTLGSTLALLLAAYVFLSVFIYLFTRSARASGYAPNTWLVLSTTGGLLVVLVAYQTLEMAGAAFFGALVLLYFLWRMPWEMAKADGEGRAAE